MAILQRPTAGQIQRIKKPWIDHLQITHLYHIVSPQGSETTSEGHVERQRQWRSAAKQRVCLPWQGYCTQECTGAVTADTRPAEVQSLQNSTTESGDGHEIITISD